VTLPKKPLLPAEKKKPDEWGTAAQKCPYNLGECNPASKRFFTEKEADAG